MRLAVFDLDHTLLAGDSDYLWGQFLCDEGLVDRVAHTTANEGFNADYHAGRLDLDAYYAFSLAPLTKKPVAEWLPLRARFFETSIRPIVATQAPALLAKHRAAGDTLLLTTATQRFVTEPVAAHLGMDVHLAAEPEIVDGRFTGRMRESNYQAGKVRRLEAWLAAQGLARPEHVIAYSDSRNDIPLLEWADVAVAVDADPTLTAHAAARGWQAISLR